MTAFHFFLALILPLTAATRSVEQRFTTANYEPDLTTAVWNLASGTIHLPVIIDRNMTDFTHTEDDTVPLGDGSDGDFDTASYATWDVNSGSVANQIILNTNRTYQFTNFRLGAGYTLSATGTEPLRIYVQGDVVIDGTLDLSGSDGVSVSSAGQTSAAGGTGIAGGKAGGNAVLLAAGEDGISADTGNLGRGVGGASVTTADGTTAFGGGGAGYRSSGETGDSSAGADTGGAPGGAYDGEKLDLLLGGSGGGAGGAKINQGQAIGAGGGAGGGLLVLHVGGDCSISTTGRIATDGGDGGSVTNGALLSGAGGGGSGGGVRLFALGQYTNDRNAGIRALGGAGGASAGGATGGAGAYGRLWVSYREADFAHAGAGNEDPSAQPAIDAATRFATEDSYTVVSKVYDSENSAPTYLALTATDSVPAGASITYFMAGSADGFVDDDTGFVSTADLSSLQGKRYFRWKAVLAGGTDDTVSPTISDITVSFEENIASRFDFRAGCSGIHSTRSPLPSWAAWSFVLALVYSSIALGRLKLKA